MRKILLINIVPCIIGMTILELPFGIAMENRIWISVFCMLSSMTIYTIILCKHSTPIAVYKVFLFGGIVLLEFILFRTIMNYIYNTLMHIIDNYLIFLSFLYYLLYNICYLIVYLIIILVKR